MAIFYVSNSATNGFTVGDDSFDGLSKLTPKLTLSSVASQANGGATGSSVIINDGTYNILAAASFKNSIKIDPVTPQGVILLATSASIQAIAAQTTVVAGAIMDIGAIVIDCNYVGNYGLSLSNMANSYNVVYRGTTLKNPRFYHAEDTRVTGNTSGSFNLYSGDTLATGGTPRGYHAVSHTSGVFDLDGITLDNSFIKTVGSGGIFIKGANGNTCQVSIKNVSGQISIAPTSGGGTYVGIDVVNIAAAVVEDVSITIQGGNGSATAAIVRIYSDIANNRSSNGKVRRVNSSNLTYGGYTVAIGNDGEGVGNLQSNDGLIEDCHCIANKSGSLTHGMMHGYNTGGITRHCSMTGGYIGMLLKNNTGGLVYGNKVIDVSAYGLYSKGSINCGMHNNDIIALTVTPIAGILIGATSDTLTTYSNNVAITNNIFYLPTAGTLAIQVAIGSSANFRSNNYSPEVLFDYNNVTYGTVSAWVASHEVTANTLDPQLIINTHDFADTSAISTIGTRWWDSTKARPIGYSGEPFSDYEISIGSCQSTKTPSHP